MSNAPVSSVQVVDRVAAVLEHLARAGEAGVVEVAAALEVHKSTASRLLASLEVHGLVEQEGDRGRYRLGLGLLRLAVASTARLDVVQESRPSARTLASETGETVNVTVLNDGAVLYLDQVSGTSMLQSHNWVGQRVPLHATSNGRVLMSGLTDPQVRELVGPEPAAFTPTTLTDLDAIVAEVALVRERGHSVVVDELEHGLTAIAAPVRDLHGDVAASMSVSGPTFRFGADEVEAAIRAVVSAAEEASSRMGHRPPYRPGGRDACDAQVTNTPNPPRAGSDVAY